jgi:hypothetical protein
LKLHERAVPASPDRLSDFVIGYHGTDEAVVEDILAGRTQLAPSPRGYDWLGDGIYFWEEDPDRAMWWAERTHLEAVKANDEHLMPVKVEKPSVIGAIVYIGTCLNLAFDENQELLNDVYQRWHFVMINRGSNYHEMIFSIATSIV